MKPKSAYLAFGACLALAFGGVAWLTETLLSRDAARRLARQQATLEENVRLGLWRMDSDIATLLAAENARPYFDYGAFYATDSVYSQMLKAPGSAALAPSPLLLQTPEHLLLHFQLDQETFSSPQVPQGEARDRALSWVGDARLQEGEQRLRSLSQHLSRAVLEDRAQSWFASQKEALDNPAVQVETNSAIASVAQAVKSTVEYSQRARSVERASKKNSVYVKQQAQQPSPLPPGVLAPLWHDELLLMVRTVNVEQQLLLQGFWVDWPALRKQLLASVKDILPGAELHPASAQDPRTSRKLAALPVRLEPGPLGPEQDADLTLWLTLAATWTGFLIAALAGIVLLVGTLSLSERRAVFVSAVTHELRTPLTTFRMYADMLADGMVKDPDKTKRYLETLRREAVRLGHLVENVLAYSRIERGRATAPPETVAAGELIERFEARLAGRAQQADMTLVVSVSDSVAFTALHVDISAVEQILFNLVDNACKYAQAAQDRRIHLEVELGARLNILVRDHGPGIPAAERRQLFAPFSKSAQRAALSAPGVGLGLALSRRLARAMGGELSYRGDSSGAIFVVELPRA